MNKGARSIRENLNEKKGNDKLNNERTFLYRST